MSRYLEDKKRRDEERQNDPFYQQIKSDFARRDAYLDQRDKYDHRVAVAEQKNAEKREDASDALWSLARDVADSMTGRKTSPTETPSSGLVGRWKDAYNNSLYPMLGLAAYGRAMEATEAKAKAADAMLKAKRAVLNTGREAVTLGKEKDAYGSPEESSVDFLKKYAEKNPAPEIQTADDRYKRYNDNKTRIEELDRELQNSWLTNPFDNRKWIGHYTAEERAKMQKERDNLVAENTRYERFGLASDRAISAVNLRKKDDSRLRGYDVDAMSWLQDGDYEKYYDSPFIRWALATDKSREGTEAESWRDLSDEAALINSNEFNFEYLTNEEKQAYYYMLHDPDEGPEVADEFIKEMLPILKYRREQEAQETIANAPLLSKVLAGFAMAPANTLGAIPAFASDVGHIITGQDIDPYDSYHAVRNFTGNVIQGAQKGLDDLTNNFGVLGLTLGNLYSAGISMEQSALGAYALGPAYTIIMGMGAASDEAKRLYEAGATKDQYALGGLFAGAAETVTEYLSLEVFLKQFMGEGRRFFSKDTLKNIFLQGIAEGSEEVASELATTFSDILVRGNTSDFISKVDQFVAEGMSEEEAWNRAIGEKAYEVYLSGAMGFISGAGMGGVGGAVNSQKLPSYSQIGNEIIDNDSANLMRSLANDLASERLGLDEKGQKAVAKAAAKYDAKGNARSLGRLTETVGNEIRRASEENIDNAINKAGLTGSDADTAKTIFNILSENPNFELSEEDQAFIQKPNVWNAYNELFGSTAYNDELSRYTNEGWNTLKGTVRYNGMTEAQSKVAEREARYDYATANKSVRTAIPGVGKNGQEVIEQAKEKGANLVAVVSAYNQGVKGTEMTGEVDLIEKQAYTAGKLDAITEKANVERYGKAVVNENPGLDRESLKKANAKYTSQEVRRLNGLGKVTGTKVEIVDDLTDSKGNPVNAEYDAKTATIRISAKSKSPVTEALAHEVVHRIRDVSKDAYNSLVRFVLNNMSEEKKMSVLGVRSIAYGTREADYVTEETVADAFGDILESDPSAIDELIKDDRKLGERIRDIIRDIITKIDRYLSQKRDVKRMTPEQRKRYEADRKATEEEFSELRAKLIQAESRFSAALNETVYSLDMQEKIEDAGMGVDEETVEKAQKAQSTETKAEVEAAEKENKTRNTEKKAASKTPETNQGAFSDYIISITQSKPTKTGYRSTSFYHISDEGRVVRSKGKVYTVHDQGILTRVYRGVPWIPDGARVGVGAVKDGGDIRLYDLYSGEQIGIAIFNEPDAVNYEVLDWATRMSNTGSGLLNELADKARRFQNAIGQIEEERARKAWGVTVDEAAWARRQAGEQAAGTKAEAETKQGEKKATGRTTEIRSEDDIVASGVLWTTSKDSKSGWGPHYNFAGNPIKNALSVVASGKQFVNDYDKSGFLDAMRPLKHAFHAANGLVYDGVISPMAAATVLASTYKEGGIDALKELYGTNGNLEERAKAIDAEHNGAKFSRAISPKDSARYLELAKDPEKNEAELSRMVEEAARKAGYDSPKLYHGTQPHDGKGGFGFTTFDMSKSDDGSTIFLTDNNWVAESYAGTLNKRNASGPKFNALTASKEAVIRKYNELNEHNQTAKLLSQNDVENLRNRYQTAIQKSIDDTNNLYRASQNKEAVETLELTQDDIAVIKLLKNNADEFNNAKTPEELMEARSSYKKIAQMISSKLMNFYSVLVNTEGFSNAAGHLAELNKLAGKKGDIVTIGKGGYAFSLESFRHRLGDDLSYEDDKGIYSVYTNTDNFLVVDCAERNWDDLRLPKELKGYAPKGHNIYYTTRDIAALAKGAGYKGVIFEDVTDVGEDAYDYYSSNVYAVFDSKNVKSADPVTYDDKGHVIPLEERFNENNDDIRYSRKISAEESRRYLELAKNPARNEKELAAMVEQAAKEAFPNSKAKDSDGNLLTMYHGTSRAGFTVFDYGHRKFGLFGTGYYFTDSKDVAEGYTRKGKGTTPGVYKVYLNIINPLDMDAKADVTKWRNALDEADLMSSELRNGMTNEEAFRVLKDACADETMTQFEAEDTIEGILTGMEYDGITYQGGGRVDPNGARHRVYIAFDSNQIKSADPVTYDDEGNVIPLEDRFNPEKEDIRYSRDLTESYEEYRRKYGTIPQGERPFRDVAVPERTERGKKVAQTVRTVLEAEATPETMVPTIKEMIADGDFSYDVYTDAEALKNAEADIKKTKFTDALTRWAKAVAKGKVNKTITAEGWALYNAAATAGDTEAALTVLRNIVGNVRSAAQALQAVRILKKMSPEAQLYNVVKTVEQLIRDAKERYGNDLDIQVDPDLAEDFLNARSDEEREKILQKIYKEIGRQLPTRWIDRWNAWRYLSMLGNPRTHVRNFAGNAGFMPVVMTKNAIATGIESAVDFVTRGKLNRTKGNLVGKRGAALLKAAAADYANVREEALGERKYSDLEMPMKEIEDNRRVFGNTKWKAWNKTGGRALEAARKFNSKMLDVEDVWFSKPHYAFAMAQYCKANGITAEQIASGKGLDKARQYAIKEAQKATYRDTNAFSQMVSRLGRRSPNDNKFEKVGKGLIEGILPFRKTPANILARGVEYSPIGLLKAISADAVSVAKGKMTGAEMIDHLSAGLTGTGLVALGMWLASMGVVKGHGGDDDKDDAFGTLRGHQKYSLEVGNLSITLDWLAPESLPFFIGVNLYEEAADKRQGGFEDLLTAIGNTSEPFIEMSCLQSLNDLLDSVGYAKSKGFAALPSTLISAASSYVSQGLPTIFGQAERAFEGKRMTTYADGKGAVRDLQYNLGKAANKIPIWDYNQIPYIDAWGREELTGNFATRLFNNFVNPSYVKTVSSDKIEDELMRVYEATGKSAVFPKRANRTIKANNVEYDLNAQDYVKYATVKGGTAYEVVGMMTQSGIYKDMTDADKASALQDAYTYSDWAGRSTVGVPLSAADSWVGKAVEANRRGITPDVYILARNATNDFESLKDKNGKAIDNSTGLLTMQYIYKISGLTNAQRRYLFESLGVGKKIIGMSAAEVNAELAKMRQK